MLWLSCLENLIFCLIRLSSFWHGSAACLIQQLQDAAPSLRCLAGCGLTLDSRFGSTDYAILFPPRQPPTPSSAGCLEREHRREVTQSRTDRLIATGPSLELQRHLLQVTQRKQDSSPDNDTGTTPSWPWPLHPCLVVSWFLPKQQHRLALVH